MSTATRAGSPSGGGKGAETRAAILERAVDLASAEGLEGLTIGRLAAELEMSKSGLFAHFGSKQELQLATVEAAAPRFRARGDRPGAGAADGAPRLRALATPTSPTSTPSLLGRLLLGRDHGRVRRPARPGSRRDRGRDRRLARRARAPGADRRGRRSRAARLRALRGGDGGELALPALGRPAGLRLAREAVERLLAELPDERRGGAGRGLRPPLRRFLVRRRRRRASTCCSPTGSAWRRR